MGIALAGILIRVNLPLRAGILIWTSASPLPTPHRAGATAEVGVGEQREFSFETIEN
jgi:hypothetical protein